MASLSPAPHAVRVYLQLAGLPQGIHGDKNGLHLGQLLPVSFGEGLRAAEPGLFGAGDQAADLRVFKADPVLFQVPHHGKRRVAGRKVVIGSVGDALPVGEKQKQHEYRREGCRHDGRPGPDPSGEGGFFPGSAGRYGGGGQQADDPCDGQHDQRHAERAVCFAYKGELVGRVGMAAEDDPPFRGLLALTDGIHIVGGGRRKQEINKFPVPKKLEPRQAGRKRRQQQRRTQHALPA